MAQTVLILGAHGKIGSHSARAFAAAGWNVRHYDRKSGDMARAAQGVDVIINGLNPPDYHDWARIIPEITREVIGAAERSGALVVIPGNVYNFGSEGGVWSEQTAHRPETRKGRIREQMERTYEASGVKTLILRAGNFITPDRRDDVLGLIYLRPLARGKIMVPGATDVMQAFCYVPDWARAAVMLSEQRARLSHFEDIPFPGHSFSAEDLRDWFSQRLQRELSFTRFPWWAVALSSPFWEMARELLEMRYLWNTSHRLSDAKFAQFLPSFESTPLDAVFEASLPDDLKRTVASSNSAARVTSAGPGNAPVASLLR